MNKRGFLLQASRPLSPQPPPFFPLSLSPTPFDACYAGYVMSTPSDVKAPSLNLLPSQIPNNACNADKIWEARHEAVRAGSPW